MLVNFKNIDQNSDIYLKTHLSWKNGNFTLIFSSPEPKAHKVSL